MQLISYAIILILSACPISLIIIKVFSVKNLKLAYTTRILTEIENILTKDYEIVKSIVFDNYKIKIKDNKKMVDIQNLLTNETLSIDKDHLQKDEILKLISLICTFTNYEKAEKTESVIKHFFYDCKINLQKLKNQYKLIAKIPTNKEKKVSTTVVKKIDSQEIFALNKGNPKEILEKCSRIIINNEKVELTEKIKRKLRKKIKILNQKGHKITAFAYKGLPYKILPEYTESFTESDLIFLGMIGTAAPLNTEVKKELNEIKRKDIEITIVTKLKEKNAVAIAKEFNLINTKYFETITGNFLKTLTPSKIEKILKNKEKNYIFAEIENQQKNMLIEILKKTGENPLLINKEHPLKLISIIDNIKKARSVILNFEKIFFHAISGKISQVLIVIFAITLKIPSPLTIASILILDLTINLLNEISLREDTNKEIQTKMLNKKIFNEKFIKKLITNGSIIGIITISILTWNLLRLGWSPDETLTTNDLIFIKTATITFVILAIFQIYKTLELFNLKLKNIYLILSGTISIMLIYALLNIETLQSLSGFTSLNNTDWQVILFTIIAYLILKNAYKYSKNRLFKN